MLHAIFISLLSYSYLQGVLNLPQPTPSDLENARD